MAIKYAFIIISTICFVSIATAQSQDAPKSPPQKQEQTTPNTSAPKTDKPSGTLKKGAPKDLDLFFKQGAEQAKKGPTCYKPPEPVA